MELRTEVEILAPAETVWNVVTDFSRYPEWNPFIVEISGKPAVGERLSVVISPPESREMRFRPKVTVAEPNRELRWLGHLFVRGLFDGEHFFRLVELDAERTRFVHGEDFRGILLKPLASTLTNTARGFVFMNQALKKRIESGAA